MTLITFMQYTFLASIIFDVAVGIWFYKNSRRVVSRTVRLYYLTLACILAWEVVTYISFFLQKSAGFNFFFNASTFSFGFFGVFCIYYFVWTFFDGHYLSHYWVWILLFASIVTFVCAYIPGLIVGEKIYVLNSQLFLLANAPLTVHFYLAMCIEFLLLVVLLFKAYHHSVGRQKQEAKILITGFGIAATSGMITYVVIPLIAKTFLVSLDSLGVAIIVEQLIGGIFVSVLSIAITYAVLRYKIFNVRYKLKRYLLILLSYLITSLVITFLTISLLSLGYLDSLVAVIVFSLLLAFIAKYVVDHLVYRTFPGQVIDLYKLSDEDRLMLDTLPSTKDFIRFAVDQFMRRLPVDKLLFYVYDPNSKCFISLYPIENDKVDVEDPLLTRLNQHKTVHFDQHKKNKFLCSRLEPLIFQNTLLGFIALNGRIDQKDFSTTDENFIRNFVKFCSMNLWNYLHLHHQVYTAVVGDHR